MSDSKPKSLSRRDFLKLSVITLATSTVLGACGRAWAQTPPTKLVDEQDATAKALSLAQDASKLPAGKRLDKMGVAGAQQTCVNCMFYKKTGELNKLEVGTCTLLPSGLVQAKGWCAGWAKKV